MENKRKLYKLSAKLMPIFCKEKINQTLARLTKEKKKKQLLNTIRNEREDIQLVLQKCISA